MVSANQKNTATGADEVYPVIVYALLKGNINKIKSFSRISKYRDRSNSPRKYLKNVGNVGKLDIF